MDSNVKVKLSQNPRANANIFEILTFSWMLNLFKIGKCRDLEENDLYVELKDHTASTLGDELEKNWILELTNAFKAIRNPNLLRALFKMFGAKYGLYGFLLFIDEIIFKMSKPLFIGGLLTHFNPDVSEKTELWYASMCATGLGFSILATILLVHLTVMEICHTGMKIRVACSSIIFRKALRLSHTALCETTVGQVLDLLSNDVNRFDRGLFNIHYVWLGPLQTIVVMYFLWQEIGVSSLLGVAFLFFFIPLQGWLGKKVFEIRLKAAQRTDERGRLLNEIIMGIQAIKMYTWEKPFEQLIKYARKKEIQHIRGITSISAVSFLYKYVQIKVQLFACILSYVFLGNYITSRKIFVVISFYNLLQNSMSIYFFSGISQIGEILVSIKRIQNFLLLEENNRTMTKSIKRTPDTLKNDKNYFTRTGKNTIYTKNNFEHEQSVGIDVLNVTAKWSEYQTSDTLENVNLTIRPGQLVAIIGPVGAGKSSLIQLILGELPVSEGNISVRGVVAYASQEPWLFTGSIQQNILFNSPMNRNRYKQVIKLCALQQDFEQFPYADRTIVGERGVTLSGGQKSRINLARAIYKEADIYLLDDPLSSVDSHVSRYLFEKCIKDYLHDKICILVTHQLQFLANVNQIVLMEKAKILAKGSSRELRTCGIDFAKFLKFSEEINIKSDVKAKNNSSNDISILCPRESDESVSSCVDENNLNEIVKEPNQVAEFRSSGKISKSVYTSYLSAVGSTCSVFILFFMFILTQTLTSGEDYWTSYWVNQEDHAFKNNFKLFGDNRTLFMYHNSTDLSSMNFRQTCVSVYIVLNVLLIVALCVGSAIFVSVCTKASFNIHNMMFDAIIRAEMYFFNTNSSGRILNRFSNDIGSIDTIIPIILIDCLQLGMKILGVVIVVGVINIYLLIPTIIMAAVCFHIRSFFLPTSRSIKQLEGVARSPILAYLNASIQGLKTIRAYEAEQTISNEFDKNLDSHSSVWYLLISSNGAFGLWLDVACFIYICILIFFLVFSNIANASYVGLAISQTISLVGLFQWTIKQFSVLEIQMNSVERIFEYINLPQEANFLSPSDKIPPENWPNAGKIVFQNLSLCYSLDSPCVLKNLSFQIQPKEKIGIIGRTGAGKSSILSAIFRLARNEGNIIIDDIEIHGLGLHDLRSKISVIPQEPVMFSGTIRKNLDPFDKYPDHILWKALEEVLLKVTIEALPGGLNSKISECGSNFSVGQKQLVSLARALVQNNKILVLDEATANVDAQTDALIQNTIRKKFRTSTVLTIAHRLNTVMDSDKVLVMDSGSVVEFGHPYVLLKNEDGFLFSMAEQTGLATFDLLHSIAATSYKNIQKKSKSSN